MSEEVLATTLPSFFRGNTWIYSNKIVMKEGILGKAVDVFCSAKENLLKMTI